MSGDPHDVVDALSPDTPRGNLKEARFIPLFLRHQRRMYSFAFTLLPNREDADDVFQESCVVMWEKFDPSQPPDDFGAWGNRIIYYKAHHFRKRKHGSLVMFSQQVFDRIAETALEHEEVLQLGGRVEALEACLGRLPESHRGLLEKRFRPGATVQSVADELGRSAVAVYKSLGKIFQALSECIDRSLAEAAR